METSSLVFVYFAGIATGVGLYFLFTLALRTRKQQLDHQITGLGEQFIKLDQLVHQYDREQQQQNGAITETLRRLNDSTNKLQRFLANDRQRGAWGEQIADGILEAAGFLRGTHFDSQQSIVNGDDASIRPDFTFYLPNNLRIHMDVKFPYGKYEAYFSVDPLEETERAQLRTRFGKDVKAQIVETRKYISVDTLDCALMFIPNETLFHFLSEDGEIREHALKNKIIICSPLSLLIVLAMIRQTSETFALERSLGSIRAGLIKISADIGIYASDMDKLKQELMQMQNRVVDLQNKRATKLQEDARILVKLIDQQRIAVDETNDREA